MPRTDQEWLDQLKQQDNNAALEDLRSQLARGLTYALTGRVAHEQLDDLVQDFAQESVLRVLAVLDTFRGESRFLTWAAKVAVRLAFSELRRKRWQDVSLDGLVENPDGPEEAHPALTDPAPGPETAVNRAMLLALVERLIDDELTERQRAALVAVFEGGVSVEELARRNGTSRNALYKLVHDARRRLQARLKQHGLTPQELLAAMESG